MSESTRGRAKKIVAPRGKGRRTQAEREQISNAEAERNKERDAKYAQEQNTARLAAERERRNKAKFGSRGRGRGRGGFIGEGRAAFAGSGPLAGGSSIGPEYGPGKAFPRPWAASQARARLGEGGKGHPSGDDSTVSITGVVKRETAAGSSKDLAYTGGIETEEGYVSSDLEEPEEGPRKAIEHINLISDDEDEDDMGSSRKAPTVPIFLPRAVHRPRAPPISTETADGTYIKVDDDDDVLMGDAPISSSKKGKQRAGTQVVEERTWTGVWTDPSDIPIKTEPSTEEPLARPHTTSKDADNDDDAPVDGKAKRTRLPSAKPSTLQLNTPEEKSEYARLQNNNAALLDAFGDKTAHEGETRNMIFQFPPVMPNLSVQKAVVIKEDPEPVAAVPEVAMPSNKDTPIKIEADAKDTKPVDPNARPTWLPKLAAGAVGKLRVHKSGKVTMNWGGTSFVVSNGILPEFLQDVVMVKMDDVAVPVAGGGFTRPDTSKKVGQCMSFGQPTGKLIVTPEWDLLLEKEKGGGS